MQKLGGNEIRTKFLEYFRSKGHEVVASSPVVPAGDPTLLFTNAGMNQFKDVFLGLDARPYRRATTSQKCVRAGGKHNDLDQVGWTARHHTFFEMLGNFSFGDYFKLEAIRFAWELLTGVLEIPAERLTATIFRDDHEAYAIWHDKIGLPPERIIRLGEKDNFWSMGDTGPCGPCSEIIYDRGAEFACDGGAAGHAGAGASPGAAGHAGASTECAIGKCDCDRWLEVWNLVFMQYNRDAEGKMTPLPRPCVDTGMGLERIASVLQEVPSNYETDLLRPYIDFLVDRTGRPYDRGEKGFPFRVIADHARSCTFCIADGVLPSNEGRGYVLRRILRRAARFGRVLGFDKPFLHELVPVVGALMGEAYPDVVERQAFIQEVIEREEARFLETLTEGTRRAEEMLAELVGPAAAPRAAGPAGTGAAGPAGTAAARAGAIAAAPGAGAPVLSGKDAFLLYDTFGFPIDLTEDMANERGVKVDRAGFEEAMAEQRRRAREARDAAGTGGEAQILSDLLADQPSNRFVGYEELEVETLVTAIALVPAAGTGAPNGGGPSGGVGGVAPDAGAPNGRAGALAPGAGRGTAREGAATGAPATRTSRDGAFTEATLVPEVTPADGEAFFLLDRCPFYAESGGQVADTGWLEGSLGKVEIARALKLPDGKFVCAGAVVEGRVAAGTKVLARVDADRRKATARNHTATHLLHRALREVLGEHAAQSGSLVTPERLRFDFSHFSPLSADELLAVEDLVNQAILACRQVRTTVSSYRDAVAAGAIALFGEKYGDEVRVVDVDSLSRELCGGTHAASTGEIGLLKIVSESGIGSGLRRIEAVTGLEALARFRRAETALANTAAALKCDPAEVPERVERLLAEVREQEKERERREARAAQASADSVVAAAERVGPHYLAVGSLPPMSMDSLREAGDHVRDKLAAAATKAAGGATGAGAPGAGPAARGPAEASGTPGGVAVLLGAPTEDGERVSLVIMVTKPLQDKGIHAGNVIREVAKVAGGGGGGRPDMAQAGGRMPSKLDEALEKGKRLLREAIGKLG